MVLANGASEAIFWFAVVGAGVAALKHLLSPIDTIAELSPIAMRVDSKGHKTLSSEGLWWGSYCFAAMNVGFCTIGIHAGVTDSVGAKRGLLLGTGVMFEAFAFAWCMRGPVTGIKNPMSQCVKVTLFGLLFLAGYALS
ncbi:unnamed protein product [Discosporangium mesarthrocarpum]